MSMRVLIRWSATDTGEVFEERVTTVREFKSDNDHMPAAWVIEQEIREHGKYTGSTFGNVTYELTRAGRRSQ